MKTIKNQNTINYYLSLYEKSNNTELWQVYKTCSDAKRQSYEDIKSRMMQEYNANNLKILSYCSNFYTCAYKQDTNLIIDTYANTYIISDCFK